MKTVCQERKRKWCAKTPQKLRGNFRYSLIIEKFLLAFQFIKIVILIYKFEVKIYISFF